MVSRLASGAAVDRYESDRHRTTAVINFLDTTKDRIEDESRSAGATAVDNIQEEEDEDYDDDEYYYEEEEEYEDGMSGDYGMDLPQGEKSQSCQSL